MKTIIKLGFEYYQKGEVEKAIEAWEQAIIIDPENNLIKEYIKQIKK